MRRELHAGILLEAVGNRMHRERASAMQPRGLFGEEFARIRAGENNGKTEEIAKEKQKKSQRIGSTATDEVFEAVASHPQSSAEQLAMMLETTPDSIRYHLRKLRKSGLIEHVGPTKGGSWKVRE